MNPLPGEEEELAEKRTLMMQSEKLAETLNDAMNELEGAKSVSGALMTAQRILMRSPLNENNIFSEIIEGLERAAVEADEAQNELIKMGEASNYSQEELEQIEERLFALRGLARKCNVAVENLPDLLMEVEEKLGQIQHGHEQLGQLLTEANEAKAAFKAEAEQLSAKRTKAGKSMADAMHKELKPLKMEQTVFQVKQTSLEESGWNAKGVDAIEFEAATNAGSAITALNKIASGGELSRFMLALKVVLSKMKSTPTIIFDEIDTGTGGAVADAIGKRLALLAEQVQVLVVTHLPQVAVRSNTHFNIAKHTENNQTNTEITLLTDQQKKEELARMLSGASITDEARSAADRLMKEAV
jgi:DNA repair protein RecN (Recombination protein N)